MGNSFAKANKPFSRNAASGRSWTISRPLERGAKSRAGLTGPEKRSIRLFQDNSGRPPNLLARITTHRLPPYLASVSAARHEKGADGCGRNFARALGVPRAAKRATSPPTFNAWLPTEERSGPSSPSVILSSWSATTCFSANVISKTWGLITLTSSITKSSRITLSSG